MSYRMLLASPAPAVVAQARALAAESGQLEIVGVVDTTADVLPALARRAVDVAVLHEDLGPLPVLDLARQLTARLPELGIVLLGRDPSPDMLRAALQAGVRGIATLPLGLEDLQHSAATAGGWSRALRAAAPAGSGRGAAAGGTLIAVAGAKGGVGATTIAVHLALEAARRSPGRVCLVDLDVAAGDVAGLLDLRHRRSLADLVEVADDLTPPQLEDSLAAAPNGLRVLLAPTGGDAGGSTPALPVRSILAALRSRFDVVVADVGTVVTATGAVGTETADLVLLVTLPDVLALRAANRVLDRCRRLDVRPEGFRVVVNRAARRAEVQPELVARTLDAMVCRASVPARFAELERAVNSGAAERVDPAGAVRTAIGRLADELLPPAAGHRNGHARRRSPLRLALRGQGGQVATELVGLAPLLGLLALLVWQLVLVGFTSVLAGHAAREAAHELAVSGDETTDARLRDVAAAGLPTAWQRALQLERAGPEGPGTDPPRVVVRLEVPLLVPGLLSTPLAMTAEAGAVLERARPLAPMPW